MNHTGRITVSINGKSYPLKFGMGALLHFSETLGYDVQSTISELTTTGLYQIKAISKFIYSSLYVESIFKDNELDLSFEDVLDWVDQSNPEELTKVMTSIMTGLSVITQVEYPESNSESKKK
jgi:hypothetical protein